MSSAGQVRILLTGSRWWPHAGRAVLADALYDLAEQLGGIDRGVVLVHGKSDPRRRRVREAWERADPQDRALTGADWHGHHIGLAAGWRVEPHVAPWATRGPAAGPQRNQVMVDLGASVCLAARLRGMPSNGTDDCARRARRAGIDVVDVWWEP